MKIITRFRSASLRKPKKRALLIGINYEGVAQPEAMKGLPQLNGPHADVLEMKALLIGESIE